jgi:regulator of protease activity HflC (stomatin/prohibitin superfamily)
MKRLILSTLLLCALVPLSGCVPHSTDSTEVGVRTVKFAFWGKMGVEEKYYAPGSTYFFLPFVNDWHTFDTKLQNMEMTYHSRQGDRSGRDDLFFKKIDGNDISLDVIIAYKIDPVMAPYILQNIADSDSALREKIVRTIARSKPRDIFGELTTEEFYDASKRDKQAQKAKDSLQVILKPMGIIIERVLTKDYRFNEKYQKAIEDKKVADQLVERNKSAQHAALEEYKRKLEEARGEVNKLVANADGEYAKAKIRVDVYYEKQEMIAKAIMAEGIAEARSIQEMNNALESAGGEALVKLRIAEALQGKQIILLPVSEGGMNFKKTDINQLLEVMGIRKLAENQP